MESHFLPVFSVNRIHLLKELKCIEGDFALLGTVVESNNFLDALSKSGKTIFLDSGAFAKSRKSWYCQTNSIYKQGRWVREKNIISHEEIRQWVSAFLKRCDVFSPDYVFAPDIIGEPLLSLYVSKIVKEEYSLKKRKYKLIGVVQAGPVLYNWPKKMVAPRLDSVLPFFVEPKSFLTSLISEYRNIGYEYIALGGLLKTDESMPMGLKFGLSNQELDSLLSWSRPQFVLGGLALSRLEILRKHNVWADSSNWLWWKKRYDYNRFSGRNALREVIN